jgi:tetratricopeptide (TPR) repeat protein
VLHDVARSLDDQQGTQAHQERLGLGLLVLQEVSDFSLPLGTAPSQMNIDSIVARHRSAILKSVAGNSLTPDEAIRRYLADCEEHLVEAAGGLPVASEALFALGKLSMIQSEQSSSRRRVNSQSAMALFRAALRADGRNHIAANELGVLLAREGRLREAREALQRSVAARPLPDTWRNLAVVHQRLGEESLALLSMSEWRRAMEHVQLASPHPVVASNGSVVHWVDKATFEGGSLGAQR